MQIFGLGVFKTKCIRVIGLACLMLLVAGPLRAENGHFALDAYRPPAVLGKDLLGVKSTEVLGHLEWALGFQVIHAGELLSLVNRDLRDERLASLISYRTAAEAAVSLGLFDILELNLTLPFVLEQSGGSFALLGLPDRVVPSSALGDLGLMLGGKVYAHRSGFQIHAGMRLGIPTGSKEAYLSDGVLRFEPSLGFGYQHRRFEMALQLAYELRAKRSLGSYQSGQLFRWGLGLRVPLWISGIHRLSLLGSAYGTSQTETARDPEFSSQPLSHPPAASLELLGGIEWTVGSFALSFAAGGAPVAAVGTPDYQLTFGLGFLSKGFHSDGGDAYASSSDMVLSTSEAASIDPVDPRASKRGFQEAGGQLLSSAKNQLSYDALSKKASPDWLKGTLDRDGDGIPDIYDLCPDEPEDFDGFEDEDGCPDPDNDGDGILDADDLCPNEPETFNGFEDQDGCPDVFAPDWVMTGSSIEAVRTIKFSNEGLTRPSQEVLLQLVEVLVFHKEIQLLRIEAHTDSFGSHESNLIKTQAQAEEVLEYLVQHGVERRRLKAVGKGEDEPIAENNRPHLREMNRRVEFYIERKTR